MTDYFILKLILSFIVGAIVIILATVLAEKKGTKIGGMIAGLPTTVVISLFFIAWTQSTDIAVQATTIIPIIGGVICLFILTYILLLRKNFWFSLIISLLLWFILSLGLVVLKFDNFLISIIAYIILLSFSYYILDKKIKVRSEPGKKIKHSKITILVRGAFGGAMITVAVILGKIGGPLLGGVFSMFPATNISTMVITHLKQGSSFSSAVMKTSLIAAISIVSYGVIVRYTYIPLGLWLGTIVSIVGSFLIAFLIYKVITSKTIKTN
jgi:uncharacterized membrane protein (GlpM family)